MIEVKNLTKKYGEHVAVNGISFTVEDGHIYGFLGENGAGKSTTMNIITGCLAATEGSVVINGHDIFDEPIEAKKLIGYLPEIPPLYQDMTPAEYLDFVGRAKGLKKAELKEGIAYVMEKTGITDVSKKLIKYLSKGYKQRVGIAQAILGDPKVIILDEPMVGLDPIQIVEIRDLIRSLAANHTVILSSHILSEISEICDDILIISHGKIVACDTTENLLSMSSEETVLEVVIKGDSAVASEALAAYDEVTKIETSDADEEGHCALIVHFVPDCNARELAAAVLMNKGILVLSMNEVKTDLEDIFIKIASEADAVPAPAAPEEDIIEVSAEDKAISETEEECAPDKEAQDEPAENAEEETDGGDEQ